MSITVHIKSGQNKWDVTIDPSKTVSEFKEEIARVSEIPADNQRLIYSGKILKDDQTVESYKIQEGHAIHLVKSGGVQGSIATSGSGGGSTSSPSNAESNTVPSNIASGQTGGFNPLSDLTSARYAGFTNLPSADMFGPDGGMNSMASQDDLLHMLDNPIFQSQMNEMLSNPQMIDFMIQSNPQLQAMGPQARQLFQSPFFRQMLTNPQMIRQSMQFANMMNPDGSSNGEAAANAFPAPGESTTETQSTTEHGANTDSNSGVAANNASNPFAAMFNSGSNPFGAMFNNMNNAGTATGTGAGTGAGAAAGTGSGQQLPAFDPSLLASMLGAPSQSSQPVEQDNRPPEERYEQQLRQLNDMGFFEFDRNVAALRRSGGSVQGALDSLLNGDI